KRTYFFYYCICHFLSCLPVQSVCAFFSGYSVRAERCTACVRFYAQCPDGTLRRRRRFLSGTKVSGITVFSVRDVIAVNRIRPAHYGFSIRTFTRALACFRRLSL